MKADKKVVDSLISISGGLAHIAMQLRADILQMKVLGLGWLAKEMKGWYKDVECQLNKVNKRILYFETDPTYDVGRVEGVDSITSMLQRDYKQSGDLLQECIAARKLAWDSQADYTPDVLEHVIGDLEEIYISAGRELSLIKTLGESGYVGARLEDE